jgi:hypothetical protein
MGETATTQWLRTPEGRVRLPVLKPFNFIHRIETVRADGMSSILGRERKFSKGEHVLDESNVDDAEVLAHPWVSRDLADGAIESPERTAARLKAEEEKNAAEVKRREQLQAEADAALERAQVAAEKQGEAGANVQSDLDTPLNQPRGRRRAAPVAAAPAAKGSVSIPQQPDLDTPLRELPRAS